ncbi:MAG TPA: TolC family protein [Thermoanaerobaculaceae bacterium]|nr:TolC family protein [Thermoanaerobaculaceae bacterium]
MKTGRFLFCLVAATAVCATVIAAEPGFVVSTNPGQQARGVAMGAPEMRLSLKDAIALALEHNINLEVSRLGLAGSEQGFLATTGVFDFLFNADGGVNYLETPATNELQGAELSVERGRMLNLYLSKAIPTGGSFSIGWTNTRSETNSTFYFLNPAYNSGLLFSLSQSLLRGFGTDVNRARIEVARRNRDISQVQFEQVVIATVQAVENAYWNLIFTIDDLKVKQHSLRLAQDLLDQTRTRVRIGTSAPIDIVQSEATVASREVDIIVAENQVDNAADLLKDLMGFENMADWSSKIVPTDALEVTTATMDLDESIAEALKRRPDLRQLELQTEISQINVLTARNATLPQLNLGVTFGFSGVGGTQTITDPDTGQVIETIPGGWSDPLSQILNRDYQQWSAGLTFSLPLENTTAKANLAQQRFALSAAKQDTALAQQRIILEVRNAVRVLDASAKAILAAVKSRELAERNLDAEQKKFANGMSTAFQVVKIQDDLASAQASELQARVTYRQAEATYRTAVGTMLDWTGVKIESEASPKEPHTGLKDTGWLKYSNYIKGDTAPPPAQQ